MRPRDLTRLESAPYDLLIVGGGIHGLACAYDAASRGLRVALVEADDFGSGATFNHQKTAHGGLRSLGAGRVGRAIALAFLAGVLVAILFGTNAPNRLYVAIAEQFGPGIDPGVIALVAGTGIGLVVGGLLGLLAGARRGTGGDAVSGLIGGAVLGGIFGALIGGVVRLAENEGSRPMVVGLLVIGGVAALVGLVLGARGGGGASGAVAGFLGGFVLGGAVGAFSAITFAWHVAIAIGLALFLGLAIALMLADVASRGIDTEALKQRFYPQASIDMGKETVEWAKARMPRGPRS